MAEHKHIWATDSMSNRCHKCGVWRKIKYKCNLKGCIKTKTDVKMCKCTLKKLK